MQGKHFKKIATGIDTRPLLNAIQSQPYLWGEITARQKLVPNQKDTESIFLRWCKTQTVEAAFTEIPAVDYPALSLLPEARVLIAEIARIVRATEIGRILIVNLRPGGIIDKHIDEGSYAAHYSRFHLAIQTDPRVKFFAEKHEGDTEEVHMDVGELWWFNNKAFHWLENLSPVPRIHLIVDAIADGFEVPLEISA